MQGQPEKRRNPRAGTAGIEAERLCVQGQPEKTAGRSVTAVCRTGSWGVLSGITQVPESMSYEKYTASRLFRLVLWYI